MIGIDIVEVERFEKNYAGLLAKVCTEQEIKGVKTVQSLAGIFAAKEAISKALKIGLSSMTLHGAEILHDESGAPYVVLHGKAKEVLGNRRIEISISHTEKLATAIAMIV